jgi:hypothetical protein
MYSEIRNGRAWYRIGGSGRIWDRWLPVILIFLSIRSGNTGQGFGRSTTRNEPVSLEMRNPTRSRRVGDNAMGVEYAFLGDSRVARPCCHQHAYSLGSDQERRRGGDNAVGEESAFLGIRESPPVLSPARLRLWQHYLHVPPLTVNLLISPSSGVSSSQSRWVVVIHFWAFMGRWLISALRRLGSSSPKISSIR